MPIINTNAKEIHCKILYCGPEGSGKKSALIYIRDRFEEKKRDFFTLNFNKKVYCLVLSIGKIFSFRTFFHIYNLNNESEEDNKNLLKGVDGVVFVASSEPKERKNNIHSFAELEKFFKEQGGGLFKLPLILQYNKRDIEKPCSVKELRQDLNKYNSRDFESSVLKGQRVLEPLKQVCKLALNDLKRSGF